jgi:carboxymethylenebutenolidase
MDETTRQQAIELYDRFTHEGIERREFMNEMSRIAGGAAAASALIGSIAASPAAAAVVPENDKRLRTSTVRLLGNRYSAYVAEPRAPARRRSTVLVIHENRGLNAHIKDIARRLALAGHYAVAPDMLSPSGGTPANEDVARDAIGKLDLAAATAAGVSMLDSLDDHSGGNGKVGAVGFCWGGAYINRLAVAAGTKLDAGVAFYGPAPSPAEVARVRAPLLLHYAGLDTRVNLTGLPWVAALKAARKPVTSYNYPDVHHAFNNDTSKERYNKAAADLAWARTLRFFARTLR